MTTCIFTSGSKFTVRASNPKRTAACCGLLLGLIATMNLCEAGMVTHTFTGTVDGVNVMGTGSLPFHIGATVTGTYFYDNSTVYSNSNSGFAEYDNAQTGISFLVNGTYAYSDSQANPALSIPNGSFVQLGASTNPPELINYQTGSLSYESDGLHTAGGYVDFGGKLGMLSSYAPGDLSTLTVDLSKVLPDNFTGASFQTYTYYNGDFTDFRQFHVHLATVDGVTLGAASPVPEPSTFALLGLGGVGLVIGTYRRRVSKLQAGSSTR